LVRHRQRHRDGRRARYRSAGRRALHLAQLVLPEWLAGHQNLHFPASLHDAPHPGRKHPPSCCSCWPGLGWAGLPAPPPPILIFPCLSSC
jgi:hypothetical protein